MSIELAEKLKTTLTDKWVVVDASVPELKRFAEWTGKVKSVNMNCRALVEFDGPVDIGWYDIDPAFLTVVDSPKPKMKKEEKPAAEKKPAAAAAPKPAAAGGSPLDAIRAAGAAKPAAAGGKPSPLDLIRQQQAAKKAGGAGPVAEAAAPAPVAEAAPAAEPPAPPAAKPAAPTTAPDGRKLSPLEMIRAQGAAKR
jgi:hypothetical protein